MGFRHPGQTRSQPGWRSIAPVVLPLVAVLGTGWVLRRQFGEMSWARLGEAVSAQSWSNLFVALGLTSLSFLCLAFYDLIGTRAIAPRRVPTTTALLAGSTGNAIANTLGFHAVTGSMVRGYIYGECGLTRAEIARIVSLAWLALGLGFLTMFGAAELHRASFGSHSITALSLGGAITAGLLLFVSWLAGGKRQLSLFGFKQPLPSARSALLQVGIGAVESASAIGALYVLLPPDLSPPFSFFAVGCIAAIALGVVAHAPGGIGVFEASVTGMLAGAGRSDLLAALLTYRVIYNLLPFALSVLALGILSLNRRDALNSTAGSA